MKRVRRMYRGGKVWAEVDDSGEVVRDEHGLTPLRYREDDERTYSVRAQEVLPIDPEVLEATQRERAEARARARRGPAAVVVHVRGVSYDDPGPAGLGVVMRWGENQRELSLPLAAATTNEAELRAVLEALRALRRPDLPVRLHTASPYVLGVLTGTWAVRANQELVTEIQAMAARFRDLTWNLGPASKQSGSKKPGPKQSEDLDRAGQLARDGIDQASAARPGADDAGEELPPEA